MPVTRTAANVSLDASLLSEAQALKLDASLAAEDGIARAVTAEKQRLWKSENAAGICAENEYIEKYGLPLSNLRQF